jgi:archaemetzincin
MNPGDRLDAAISILPDGAYALLFPVHQDLFESPEDEFVCGHAYGASRVAVVSMARYNTSLDCQREEERDHAWPDVVQQRLGQLLRPGRN